MDTMYTVTWIRGPDCQCKTCQRWKDAYILPLRGALWNNNHYLARPSPGPDTLREMQEEVRLIRNHLSYPRKKWWEPRSLQEAHARHWRAQIHFLGWLSDELRAASNRKEAESGIPKPGF